MFVYTEKGITTHSNPLQLIKRKINEARLKRRSLQWEMETLSEYLLEMGLGLAVQNRPQNPAKGGGVRGVEIGSLDLREET